MTGFFQTTSMQIPFRNLEKRNGSEKMTSKFKYMKVN